MPKSPTLTPEGSSRACRRRDDLAAEAVVAQPRVADAGDEDLLLGRLRHVWHTSTSPVKKNRKRPVSRISVLAGIVVDGHAEVELVLVVEVDALDRGDAAVEDLVVGVAAVLEAQHDLVAQAVGDAVDVDLLLAGRLGVRRPRGSESTVRPCRARRSSGVAAAARSIISRTAGSAAAISVALAVAEREDVQQQRLLDLGAVEEVAAALGGELRVVGQHDRRAEQRVVGVGREHREGVDALARSPCASSGETKRPPSSREDRVRGEQARAQRLGAVQALGHRRGVVHAEHHAPAAVAEVVGRHPHAAVQRAVLEGLRRAASRPARASRAPRRLEAPRHRLVASSPAPCRKRTSPVSTASPSAGAMPCMRSWSKVLGVDLRVGRRVDDAERRRRRVLGRARRVRVERVALVQQRAEQLLERRRPSSARLLQQLGDAGVEDGSPGSSCRAAAARDRVGVQPHPARRWGSGAAIISRQVATGMRHCAEHVHGMSTTCIWPSSPRCRIEPVKWKLSGTSPSGRL